MNARPRPIDPEPAGLSDEQLAREAGVPGMGPLSELGRELLEIRRRYLQSGGKLYSREEALRRYDLWDDDESEESGLPKG